MPRTERRRGIIGSKAQSAVTSCEIASRRREEQSEGNALPSPSTEQVWLEVHASGQGRSTCSDRVLYRSRAIQGCSKPVIHSRSMLPTLPRKPAATLTHGCLASGRIAYMRGYMADRGKRLIGAMIGRSCLALLRWHSARPKPGPLGFDELCWSRRLVEPGEYAACVH
jgi:hypothetical protein